MLASRIRLVSALRLAGTAARPVAASNSLIFQSSRAFATPAKKAAPVAAAKNSQATKEVVAEGSSGTGEKDKKAKDPNKLLSYELLDRDNKLDDVAKVIVATPDESFNNVNVSVGLYRLGRLLSNASEDPNWERTKATKKLLRLATSHTYEPRTCANMCFGAAVGRAETIDASLTSAFLAHVAKDQLPKVPQYTAKQLTVMAWSFAMIQSKEDAFLKRVFEEAATRSTADFEGKDLPKLMWAMGRAQIKNQKLADGITKHMQTAQLDALDPNDISGLVWGMGKLQLKDETLLKLIAEEVIGKRQGFEAAGFSLQSMSRLMWGLAAIPFKDESLIKSALDVTRRRARFLRPQSRKDLTFAMWTFGAKEFEEHLANADAEVQARKRKAEEAKKLFLERLQQRALLLAEKRGPSAAAPSAGQ